MSEIVFLPGWGMSGAVFDELRGRLSATRIAEHDGTVIVGWSLGAQRALERARATPQHVRGLVLIAATPCFVRREDWLHGVERGVFDRFAQSLERDVTGTLDRFVSLQAEGDADAKRVMRALRHARGEADAGALSAALRALRDNDLRAILHEVLSPALIIHGDNDTLVPKAAAEYLARKLPRARCETIRGAAHAPFVSDPVHVARLIEDFIGE